MRCIGIALLATTALIGSAAAADMPVKVPVYKAPVVAPSYNWSGFYIGGNIGYSWGRSSDYSTLSNGAGTVLFANASGVNLDGIVGGGQVGYNWQVQNWVVGVEADIQGTDEKGSRTFTCPIGVCSPAANPFAAVAFVASAPISVLAMDQKIEWFGTVRARGGVLVSPRVLLYATGGLAYGGVKANTTIVQSDSGIQPGNVTATYAGTASTSTTRAGWTVGVGGEWMLAGNWSAKIEYLYYDLGKVSYGTSLVANAAGFATPTWVVNTLSSTRFNGSIARVGLDYHFGGPK